MKKKLINAIKIIIPLSIGGGLIWLFYDALCENQKSELFRAFKTAHYSWVLLSLVLGWMSHLSRAARQRYLLEPLGYKVSFWNSYHALMTGYLINLLFPRAGEASRAGILTKSDNVPFDKGFGTIIAERAIDVVMLGIIGVLMLVLQIDKIDLFQEKIQMFRTEGIETCGNQMVFHVLGLIIKWGVILGVLAAIVLFIFKPHIRQKLIDLVRGVFQGLFSIFKSKNKLPFIGHTIAIWVLYVAMFSLCFYSLDDTAHLGLDAMLAGFVAGTLGMVFVQGGIGVYPAFVGLIITIYLAPADYTGISPEALALGWIIWASQTIMMIILGLVSMIVSGKNVSISYE